MRIVEEADPPPLPNDALALQTLTQFRFAPPSVPCVAHSAFWEQGWPLEAQAPSPGEPATPASPSLCGAPFVHPYRLMFPRRRESTGTATVDVALDATARVTGVHLATSSGNKQTDYSAAVAARHSIYVFVRQPNCAPTATTYRLELTFR
jgi:TonB family protein